MSIEEILAGPSNELDKRVLHAMTSSKDSMLEVQKHFRAQALRAFQKRFEDFAAGKLFRTQREGFGEWLSARSRDSDMWEWDQFDADAYVAGIECRKWSELDPAYSQVRNFYVLRLLPTESNRAKLAGELSFQDSFARVNRSAGWQW